MLEESEAKGIDVNAKADWNNHTGLHLACIFGHEEVVSILLDNSEAKQININARNRDGNDGFSLACIFGHKEVVLIFLDKSERQRKLTLMPKTVMVTMA